MILFWNVYRNFAKLISQKKQWINWNCGITLSTKKTSKGKVNKTDLLNSKRWKSMYVYSVRSGCVKRHLCVREILFGLFVQSQQHHTFAYLTPSLIFAFCSMNSLTNKNHFMFPRFLPFILKKLTSHKNTQKSKYTFQIPI